jgi:choline dehydrogenase
VSASGGFSVLTFNRSTEGAFQEWANLVDDQSYTFNNLLPYFKKSCHLTAPDYTKRNTNATVTYNAAAFDNTLNGPLQISWPNWGSPLNTWIEQGFAAVGIPQAADFNSGSLFGYSWVSTTINPSGEVRDSSQTSFLAQAMANTGISVYLRTMAKKILFKNGNVASGVQVQTLGITYTLTARKEVILSAGAFQSPQMLMVSGIGPPATLQSFGIPVISALAGVGQNMWDHVMFGTTYPVNVTTGTTLVSNLELAASATLDYVTGTGPLTAPGFGVLGFEKLPAASRTEFSNATVSTLATLPSDWPEVEYLGLDGILGYWHNALDQFVDGNYGSVGSALVAPFSRGNVTIQSADSNVAPLINPNFLSHPADIDVSLAAFKRTRYVWAASGVTTGPEYLPGASVSTDDEIIEWIRSSAMTVWHAASTCAMGVSSNPMAVVDSTAKVFGVTGLRVVDASIFPILPPGHPQSACYVLAEKIADDILSGN